LIFKRKEPEAHWLPAPFIDGIDFLLLFKSCLLSKVEDVLAIGLHALVLFLE
jgi:hypothetical protein